MHTQKRIAHIFAEADGFRFSDAGTPYLYAFGASWPTVAACVRALADLNIHLDKPFTHYQRGLRVRRISVS